MGISAMPWPAGMLIRTCASSDDKRDHRSEAETLHGTSASVEPLTVGCVPCPVEATGHAEATADGGVLPAVCVGILAPDAREETDQLVPRNRTLPVSSRPSDEERTPARGGERDPDAEVAEVVANTVGAPRVGGSVHHQRTEGGRVELAEGGQTRIGAPRARHTPLIEAAQVSRHERELVELEHRRRELAVASWIYLLESVSDSPFCLGGPVGVTASEQPRLDQRRKG
eukprot:scaffold12443_cov108-Isochrysis_galbana.AAC.6